MHELGKLCKRDLTLHLININIGLWFYYTVNSPCSLVGVMLWFTIWMILQPGITMVNNTNVDEMIYYTLWCSSSGWDAYEGNDPISCGIRASQLDWSKSDLLIKEITIVLVIAQYIRYVHITNIQTVYRNWNP